MDIEEYRRLCKKAHGSQLDKMGNPYYLHPFAVSDMCNSIQAKKAALLHDVLEDTEYTYNDLVAAGVECDVIEAVLLLTRPPQKDYMEYVNELLVSEIAAEVKWYDLAHNTDLTRSNGKIVVSNKKWGLYSEAKELIQKKYNFSDAE